MAKRRKEKQEKKPIKNYVILVLLFLAVIALTVYLCECYKVYNEEQKKIPVIRGTLTSEITEVDVEPFIVENPTTVLYMCTSSSEKCRNFEIPWHKSRQKSATIGCKMNGEQSGPLHFCRAVGIFGVKEPTRLVAAWPLASFLYAITKEESWLAKFERPRFCSARMLAGF